MTARFPRLAVHLELVDRLVDVVGEGFDLDVRVGDEIAPHMIARPLAGNHRVLCASPAYLDRHGVPDTLASLAAHRCLVIKERDHPFGQWRLTVGGRQEIIRIAGAMSTNQGEVAVQWALDGQGIVLRSVWEVAPLLATGRLRRVLPEVVQVANVWAVYPEKTVTSAKVRACVEFLVDDFADRIGLLGPGGEL